MSCVLIIDDDENMLRLMRKILERKGYEVLDTPDGRKGMKLCRSGHVDLVITDIVMPEMEGLEVIMALRQEMPDIKIIAISGGGRIQSGDYLELASLLGANISLSKPFNPSELIDAVRALIG